MIARCCKLRCPSLWRPAPLNERRLKALAKRLTNLQEMRQMEENRLEVSNAVVQPSIRTVIAVLDAQNRRNKARDRRGSV